MRRIMMFPRGLIVKILQLSDTLLPLRGVWCSCYVSWDAVSAALHSSPLLGQADVMARAIVLTSGIALGRGHRSS